MDCEHYNEQLSALLDGALSPRQARRVREHVAGCRRCREDLGEIEAVRSLLRALPAPRPSEGFWHSTHTLLRERRGQPARSRSLRPHMALACLTAAAAVALTLIATPTGRPPALELPVSPASLVALHAAARAGDPLADAGSLRCTYTEANALDWSDDAHLDVD